MAVRASFVDSSPLIAEVRKRVEHEVAVFKLILIRIDHDAETATFKLHDPEFDKPEQTVSVGDYLMDRFLVVQVGQQSVRLQDTTIKPPKSRRIITAELLSQVIGE